MLTNNPDDIYMVWCDSKHTKRIIPEELRQTKEPDDTNPFAQAIAENKSTVAYVYSIIKRNCARAPNYQFLVRFASSHIELFNKLPLAGLHDKIRDYWNRFLFTGEEGMRFYPAWQYNCVEYVSPKPGEVQQYNQIYKIPHGMRFNCRPKYGEEYILRLYDTSDLNALGHWFPLVQAIGKRIETDFISHIDDWK